MARDKNEYGFDVEKFRPERFLEAKRRDPALLVFGFGRRCVCSPLLYRCCLIANVIRSCPGKYVALNSMFIVASCILQMFKIIPELNEDGTEKPVEPKWLSGLTRYGVPGCLRLLLIKQSSRLEPFPASFAPRFEGAERLNTAIY